MILFQARDFLSFKIIENLDVNQPALGGLHRFLFEETEKADRILGKSLDLYGTDITRESRSRDLVSPIGRLEVDPFSALVVERFIPWLATKVDWKVDHIMNEKMTNDETWYRVTMFITGLVASLVQVAFIAILFAVKTLWRRLIIMAVMLPVLSLLLMVFSTPKRNDFFFVSASLLAVLIIFLGSNSAAAT